MSGGLISQRIAGSRRRSLATIRYSPVKSQPSLFVLMGTEEIWQGWYLQKINLFPLIGKARCLVRSGLMLRFMSGWSRKRNPKLSGICGLIPDLFGESLILLSKVIKSRQLQTFEVAYRVLADLSYMFPWYSVTICKLSILPP